MMDKVQNDIYLHILISSMVKMLQEGEMTADQIFETMMNLNGEDHHGAMYIREAAVKIVKELNKEELSSD